MAAQLHLGKLGRQERQARIAGINTADPLQGSFGVVEAPFEQRGFREAQRFTDDRLEFGREFFVVGVRICSRRE